MSKAMLVMDKPKKCGDCNFIRPFETGAFSRNPHCCCELMWFLKEEDYRVDKNTLDENCPLREVPKKKNDNPLASDTMYKYGYAQGYNACIDEILGDKE